MTPLYRCAFIAGPAPAGISDVPLRALTSQCVAVHGQRVQQHLGVCAIGFGALQMLGGVPDESAVAVRFDRCALTAGISHEPLLASPHGVIPMPRRSWSR